MLVVLRLSFAFVWSQKLVPKRKPAKDVEKKIPVFKATVMKNSGAARGLTPEKGPGWCSICQRNCVTEVALRQHLEGKGHRRKVERQKVGAEVAAAKTAKEDGGVTNMLEQVWMQVSMMGKSARTAKPKKKRKAEEAGNDVQPTKANANAQGEPKPIVEEKPKPIIKGEPKPTAEGEPSTMKKKVVEMVRCELCNVECNSQTVLEIHLGGRKHGARLKKLQESVVACSTEQPPLQ
ncbi:hypothetical protein L7F22_059122 [Adiantum nelumboides]|nr:hypothetical protein [Adiantum nelumboides]